MSVVSHRYADNSYVIGVDIGGTFTDLVVLSAAGGIHHTKAPTTPWDFAAGCGTRGRAASAGAVERDGRRYEG